MSCAFEDDLTAYVDQELPPSRAAELRQHLEGCAACRATEALLRRTVETLHQLPAFEPSVAMRRELLTRVDALPVPWTRRLLALLRPRLLVPAGTLLTAAVLAVVLTGRHHRAMTELPAPAQLELAMNYDVVDNYEVLGVDTPEDLDVVENLQELENTP